MSQPRVVAASLTLWAAFQLYQPTNALLINYQSTNLGLLPNGYNLATSNQAPPSPSPANGNPSPLEGQYRSIDQTNNNQLQIQQQQQQQPQEQYHSNQPTGLSGHPLQSQQSFSPTSTTNNNPRNGQQTAISDRDASPIFRFNAIAQNSTTVKLVWSLMSGYTADSFEIRYGPVPDYDVYSLTLNGSARDATIGMLQPGQLYQFALRGFHGGGGSDAESNARSHSWKPQIHLVRMPAPNHHHNQKPNHLVENGEITPLGVKAEGKSNQSIQLSWTEQDRPLNLPNSKRVNIIRYHVLSSPESSPTETTTTTTTQTPGAQNATANIKYYYLNTTEAHNRDNRITINRLAPATEYAFAVKTAYYSPDMKKLFTSSGFSMDTSAKTFNLEPSAPRNFTIQPIASVGSATTTTTNTNETNTTQSNESMAQVELTWAPPESPNGQLRGYVIMLSLEPTLPDYDWTRTQVNDPNATYWFYGNLKRGINYYFKMRAVNQRGQSADSEMRLFVLPPTAKQSLDRMSAPIPANNILMMIVLCLIAILFVLFLVVSLLFCRSQGGSSKARRKSSMRTAGYATTNNQDDTSSSGPKLNGFASTNSSSTVTGRMGTLARRSRLPGAGGDSSSKPDFWISAMDQQQQAIAAAANNSEIKSNISDKSDINMAAMVSIQRDSPQQYTTQTTQLAPMLPEYRFQQQVAEQQLMHQVQQQQSHYHTGHQFQTALGFDQMDNATASALMTLSKRQQQQLQKYQIQFASSTGGSGGAQTNQQAPSPHQEPPPPPPLNIEQQQQQQQQHQPIYGTHQHLNSTRSLRIHRPTLYDPVSGSFVQQQQQDTPPNYNSHLNSMLNGVHHQLQSFNNQANPITSTGSNTLQFHNQASHHNHQTSTLLSRRSTNTLRSFSGQSGGGGGLYGQLGGQFAASPPTSQGGPHLLQSHQAVINQLNNQSSFPPLPLKHVSAVRPQVMSSLEDQIEMELAEKQAEQQNSLQQQQQQQLQDPQT